jgi:HD-GYP domain-containing protein (c-di-GMP phosphodiesterase class II)
MTSVRPYRAALTHDAALEELRQGAGSQFDAAVVAAFLDVAGRSEPEAAADDLAHDLFRAAADRAQSRVA